MIYPTLGEWKVIADTTPQRHDRGCDLFHRRLQRISQITAAGARSRSGTDAQAADETSEAAE
jgi:hypothetical protein